jgi:hypothetical protein
VAGVFGFALPRVASYGAVWDSLRAMTWPWLGVIGLTMVASLVTTWLMIAAVIPSLRLRNAATVNLGSSAVANTLPGGGAVAMGVSWAMLSGWGVETSEYVRYTLVSGLWNVFVRLGLPVVALAVLVITGTPSTASQAAAYSEVPPRLIRPTMFPLVRESRDRTYMSTVVMLVHIFPGQQGCQIIWGELRPIAGPVCSPRPRSPSGPRCAANRSPAGSTGRWAAC